MTSAAPVQLSQQVLEELTGGSENGESVDGRQEDEKKPVLLEPRASEAAAKREASLKRSDPNAVAVGNPGAFACSCEEEDGQTGSSTPSIHNESCYNEDQNNTVIVAHLIDQNETEAANREIERLKQELAAAQQQLQQSQKNAQITEVQAVAQALEDADIKLKQEPSKSIIQKFLPRMPWQKKARAPSSEDTPNKSKSSQSSSCEERPKKSKNSRSSKSKRRSKATSEKTTNKAPGPTTNEKVVAAFVAAKNQQQSAEVLESMFASPDLGIRFEDGAVLPARVFAKVCQSCFRSFPDLAFGYDAIQEVKPGEVLLDNYVVHGTHSGEPFAVMHFSPVPTTNKHVVNDPERVYFGINADGKISSMRIFSQGNFNGPLGLYLQVGGKLE